MSNLYESLMERMEGRPYNNYFACFCPWDKHESPAMLVFEDGMVKCLSCNKIWSHAQLDKKIGSHFIPQLNYTVSRILPRWKKWENEYGSLEGIADAAHRSLKRHPAFQTYFRKRKIYEYADKGNLGYLDGYCTFPILDNRGRIVNLLVRSSSNKKNSNRYVIHPNGDNGSCLYCPDWNQVNQAQTVYVTYGIIDAISLHLAGLPSVTGITGKSLSADLLRPLGKRFVIIPDKGEEQEARLLANKLGWRCTVKQLKFPENCKDADDVRRNFGNEYLLNAIGA
jgi:hypothetical protein